MTATGSLRTGIDILPLTPLQKGLLFHALYDADGRDPYVRQTVLHLEGPVDAGALRRAGQALLERHENLRAVFRYDKLREPVQVIPREAPLEWQEHDLSALSRL
jgi:hypothetical protein